mmetsp:Transcript_11916/g.22920  ORF Transcript_11916/g.22920 Transcript_11916/m.22920 type:complete len:202 (-) Transcript_11916:793-1398(-)
MDSRAAVGVAHVAKDSYVPILPSERDTKVVVGISPQLLFFQGKGRIVPEQHLQGTVFLRNIFNTGPRIKPFAIIGDGSHQQVAIQLFHVLKGTGVVARFHETSKLGMVSPIHLQALFTCFLFRFYMIICHPRLLPMIVDNGPTTSLVVAFSIRHATHETETTLLELVAQFSSHESIVSLEAVTDIGPAFRATVHCMSAQET